MTRRDEENVLRLLLVGAAAVVIGFAFALSDTRRIADEHEETTVVQEVEHKEETTEPVTYRTDKEPDVLWSLGEYKLTAYCSCEKCCGYWATVRPVDGEGNPIVYTSDGSVAKHGVTVAADTDILPFGTVLVIDGNEYTVQDRGSAVKGKHIDIYFDSHEAAKEFGVKHMEIFKKEEM
jgi:3D (Asp-Asp-Asp) domain-containing protein